MRMKGKKRRRMSKKKKEKMKRKKERRRKKEIVELLTHTQFIESVQQTATSAAAY
jgi:hypothetical protein